MARDSFALLQTQEFSKYHSHKQTLLVKGPSHLLVQCSRTRFPLTSITSNPYYYLSKNP